MCAQFPLNQIIRCKRTVDGVEHHFLVSAPQWRCQVALCAVTGETVYDDFGTNAAQASLKQTNVFVELKSAEFAGQIICI